MRGSCAGSGGLVRGLVRGLGCCRHRIWHRIAKSLHLYGSERFLLGAGHQNHCKINAFVWFGKVDWGAGHEKSFPNLYICIVLEVGWGSGRENHFKSNAFVWFWKVGGAGHQNHCKINACVWFWNVSWGSGAPDSLQNLCICKVLEG